MLNNDLRYKEIFLKPIFINARVWATFVERRCFGVDVETVQTPVCLRMHEQVSMSLLSQ